MNDTLLDLLRCPFCGTPLRVVDGAALVRDGNRTESGVLGCECCAFPVVAGIPVMMANDGTRQALRLLESGQKEQALFSLLGLDAARGDAFRRLLARGAAVTYREALGILSEDAEGTYFAYRFSDPTFIAAEALLQATSQQTPLLPDRCLDLCGGTGQLARALAGLRPGGTTVLADVAFWKLWLATRFNAPGCLPVCCDANQPLPFARELFSQVVLADAFHYIWHKRLLAEEMMRLAVPQGVVVVPHVHSALGENFAAGDTLTPRAYLALFAARAPRLFSDARLLTDVLEHRMVDLNSDLSPEDLGTEASLTVIAGGRADLFQRHVLPPADRVMGELRVNPLYRVEWRGGSTTLTLAFPTSDYEEEFGACRRYLPDTVIVDADLTGAIASDMPGSQIDDLRRRRIIIDAPPHYW